MAAEALPKTEEFAPVEDRRADDRFVTIFRAGKLTRNGFEQLCMVRNISSGGAMINFDGVLEVGDAVTLDLRLDEHIGGVIAWVVDDRAGLAFDSAADLERLLARHRAEGKRPRPPRLRVDAQVQAKAGDAFIDVRLCDISQNGACFAVDDKLLPREPEIRLHLGDLGDYRAIVRWRRYGLVGVGFASTLPMWILNEWVRTRRNWSGR